MSKEKRIVLIQVLLFIATFITTTLAGAEWSFGKSVYGDFGWPDFIQGMHFSIPFLLILTVHEFGHYFTAMYHKVKSSLPYYIPIPPLPFSIGTMGAVIRLRSHVESTKQNFDIGIAGPLAGFMVAVMVLIYGFVTLPPAEHIFQIHPNYEQYGVNYAEHVYKPEAAEKGTIDVVIGRNLLFLLLEKVADPARVPNPHEIMHYPYLFAGFLALIFTCLNLMPIGQLDGGHVLYGMVGYKWHRIIASVFFVAFIFYAGLGLEYIQPSLPLSDLQWAIPIYILFLYTCFLGLGLPTRDTIMYTLLVFAGQFIVMVMFPHITGYSGWLLFGFILGRFLGIRHPQSRIEEPLDEKRKILGWIAVIIFILCFTPQPIQFFEY